MLCVEFASILHEEWNVSGFNAVKRKSNLIQIFPPNNSDISGKKVNVNFPNKLDKKKSEMYIFFLVQL